MLPGGLLVVGVFIISVPELAKEIQNILRKVNNKSNLLFYFYSYFTYKHLFYIFTVTFVFYYVSCQDEIDCHGVCVCV